MAEADTVTPFGVEQRGGGPYRHPPLHLRAELDVIALEAIAPGTKTLPIEATCSTRFRALRTSGTRHWSEITLLVVHSTEGATALGAASWFQDPRCQGSAHVTVDGRECFQTLPPSAIPWGAPGVNERGWHLELAGYAHWTRADWMIHEATLRRGAFKLAWHARAFEIPLRRLTLAELAAGQAGVVGHWDATRVYGGSHTDPGRTFPWPHFMATAQNFYVQIERGK